jgi:hypothetical protein
MSASITAQTSYNFKENFAAHSLGSAQRQEIAIQALGRIIPFSHMANNYSIKGIFFKFVIDQLSLRKDAHAAIAPRTPDKAIVRDYSRRGPKTGL